MLENSITLNRPRSFDPNATFPSLWQNAGLSQKTTSFGEISAITDLSFNGNGSVQGTSGDRPSFMPGFSNDYAIEFDAGSTDVGAFGSDVSFSGQFFVSFWVVVDDVTTNQTIIGHSSDTSKVGTFGSKLFIRVISGGSSDNTIGVESARPYHVVITRNESNVVSLYLNGESKGNLFSGAAQSGTFRFNRLAFSTGLSRLDGTLDEIVVGPSHVSSSEALALYASNTPPASASGRWRFEEGAGSTASDSIGSNNISLTSASWSSTKKPGGIAGHPAYFFDGVGDHLDIAYDASTLGFTGTADITTWAVVSQWTSATSRIINQASEIVLRTTGGQAEFLLNSFSSNDRAAGGAVAVGTPSLLVGYFDGTTITIRLNGVVADTAVPTGTYGGNTSSWIVGSTGTAEYFHGLIADFGVVKGYSIGDVQRLENYLLRKYGVV